MRYEGSLEVLANLLRKKYLLELGDPSSYDIRAGLLAHTGVLRGAYASGQGVALEHFRLAHAFDIAAGVSTGFPVLAYLLARQIEQHADIYWTEAASKEFISFSRLLGRRRVVADTGYLCSVFRGHTKRQGLNEQAVQHARTRLFAGVTDAQTGEGIFLNSKKVKPDLVEAIHATCAMPGFSTGPVVINGRSYIDGATAMTFPARKFIEEFAPTDLLVLANRAGFTGEGAFFDRLTSIPFLRKFPKEVRRVHANRYVQAQKELEYLRTQRSCRYLILWSDDELGRFTRDPAKLQAAAKRAQKHLEELLLDAQATTKIAPRTLAAE